MPIPTEISGVPWPFHGCRRFTCHSWKIGGHHSCTSSTKWTTTAVISRLSELLWQVRSKFIHSTPSAQHAIEDGLQVEMII